MNIFTLFVLIFACCFESPSFAIPLKTIQRSPQVVLTGSIASFEEYCHQEINKVREVHGLPPLTWWPQLADCAREHSQNMANGLCPFGHEGFERRAKQMGKFARIYFFGENVAYSYNYKDPVKISVEGWMKSEGHRENILADFKETGIGVAITKEGKFYVTQLFASRS